MKAHNIVPFVLWLFGKWFGGVGRLYKKYDDFVVKEPGFAFMPTFMISLLSGIVFMVVFAILGIFPFFLLAWLIFVIIAFSNYIRIILREQYKKFRAERQELFNTIKST